MNSNERPAQQDARTPPQPALACRRFLEYAALLSALFLVATLAGFREYTSVLSGTESSGNWQRLAGMGYALLYVCFVGIVPVLLIAAGLMQGMRLCRRKCKGS